MQRGKATLHLPRRYMFGWGFFDNIPRSRNVVKRTNSVNCFVFCFVETMKNTVDIHRIFNTSHFPRMSCQPWNEVLSKNQRLSLAVQDIGLQQYTKSWGRPANLSYSEKSTQTWSVVHHQFVGPGTLLSRGHERCSNESPESLYTQPHSASENWSRHAIQELTSAPWIPRVKSGSVPKFVKPGLMVFKIRTEPRRRSRPRIAPWINCFASPWALGFPADVIYLIPPNTMTPNARAPADPNAKRKRY